MKATEKSELLKETTISKGIHRNIKSAVRKTTECNNNKIKRQYIRKTTDLKKRQNDNTARKR